MLRRRVANNHECLFTAISYLVEGSTTSSAAARLRAVCAKAIREDEDRFNELVLGKPNEDYAKWIENPFNWGGENELIILAEHFNTEICVVTFEGTLLTYGQHTNPKGRIYLLYTGQHYDPLVGGAENCAVENEQRTFPAQHAESEQLALKIAQQAKEEADLAASQRTRKAIKCCGCGAILATADEFQQHCGEVDHDDDFAYDCEEIEIVEPKDSEVIGGLDPSKENVVSVYNTHTNILSNHFPAAITIEGKEYSSVEHYWMALQCLPDHPDVAEAIRNTRDFDEARKLFLETESNTLDGLNDSNGASSSTAHKRPEILETSLLFAMKQKFTTHPNCAQALRDTCGKRIAVIDNDMWAGMIVRDGVVFGKNNVGRLLELIRDELN